MWKKYLLSPFWKVGRDREIQKGGHSGRKKVEGSDGLSPGRLVSQNGRGPHEGKFLEKEASENDEDKRGIKVRLKT